MVLTIQPIEIFLYLQLSLSFQKYVYKLSAVIVYQLTVVIVEIGGISQGSTYVPCIPPFFNVHDLVHCCL